MTGGAEGSRDELCQVTNGVGLRDEGGGGWEEGEGPRGNTNSRVGKAAAAGDILDNNKRLCT